MQLNCRVGRHQRLRIYARTAPGRLGSGGGGKIRGVGGVRSGWGNILPCTFHSQSPAPGFTRNSKPDSLHVSKRFRLSVPLVTSRSVYEGGGDVSQVLGDVSPVAQQGAAAVQPGAVTSRWSSDTVQSTTAG